jgi:hypothetical protein
VCAPSNAAVDHLVERLLGEGLRDRSKLYTPQMLRIGPLQSCSDRVKKVTLAYQVKLSTNEYIANQEDFKNVTRLYRVEG